MNAGSLPLPPGTTVRPGVVLSLSAYVGLWIIAAAYKFGHLDVTSGTRTSEAQAAAMLAKPAESLRALYARDDIIETLLSAQRTVAAWSAIIDAYAAEGDYLSDHQKGDALDFAIPSDPAALIAACRRVGLEAIDEGNHIHAEGLPGPMALGVPVAASAAALLLVWNSRK